VCSVECGVRSVVGCGVQGAGCEIRITGSSKLFRNENMGRGIRNVN